MQGVEYKSAVDVVKVSAKLVAVFFPHEDYKVFDVRPVSYRLEARFAAELEGSPQIRLDPPSRSQIFTTLLGFQPD